MQFDLEVFARIAHAYAGIVGFGVFTGELLNVDAGGLFRRTQMHVGLFAFECLEAERLHMALDSLTGGACLRAQLVCCYFDVEVSLVVGEDSRHKRVVYIGVVFGSFGSYGASLHVSGLEVAQQGEELLPGLGFEACLAQSVPAHSGIYFGHSFAAAAARQRKSDKLLVTYGQLEFEFVDQREGDYVELVAGLFAEIVAELWIGFVALDNR